MDKSSLIQLLEDVKDGKIDVEEAVLKFQKEPFEDLGFAKIDNHRELRQGIAEVIYGEGKTAEQIGKICQSMEANGQKTIIVTRISDDIASFLEERFTLSYSKEGRIAIVGEFPEIDRAGKIVVATGGTSDMPVAEEAAITAEALGNDVQRLYDVGVAGLDRLLSNLDSIMEARVIIAVAGMEGALASVIGGLAECPVIGVPTSVGYGTAMNGMSALFSTLNSCASGLSVVNIDNGFGAGYLASQINHL